MEIFQNLSVQIVIITLPILIYETFWLTSQYRNNKKVNILLFTLLSSFASVTSMSFSIHIGYDVHFHFGVIPIVLAFYYGNIQAGILSLILPIIYVLSPIANYSYNNDDIISLLLIAIIVIPSTYYWKSYSKKKKVLVSSLYGFVYELIGFMLAIISGKIDGRALMEESLFLLTLLLFYFLLIGIIALNVYLKEYIIENTIIREEMQRSEKLQIVSELAASVAHEVRNPLTVVRGFIQLIENDEFQSNKAYLKLVLNELDRAENIISDYLNLARPQIEHNEIFNISDCLHEVCTIMSTFATLQGIYLKVTIEEELYMRGDRNRLKQAIMNVLKNGVEAVGRNKGYLSIRAYLENEYIVVIIKDNGNGMTKEQIDRLGEPYYSLKEKGTGLGLMVTFSILEAHNGRIKYKSEIEQGTVVKISLPSREKYEKYE